MLQISWPKHGRIHCSKDLPNFISLVLRFLNVFSQSLPILFLSFPLFPHFHWQWAPSKTKPTGQSTQLSSESLKDSTQRRLGPQSPKPQPGSKAPPLDWTLHSFRGRNTQRTFISENILGPVTSEAVYLLIQLQELSVGHLKPGGINVSGVSTEFPGRLQAREQEKAVARRS